MPERTTVFVSYCRKDAHWLERLQVHLKPFCRRGDLNLWDDTRIGPGARWRTAIRTAIEEAAASILLVSADFLASDFVVSEELPTLLQNAEKAGARIVPIVVEPCRLANHPELAAFQTINRPNQPLSRMERVDAEDVFINVAEEIEKLLARPVPGNGIRNGAVGSVTREVFDQLQSATIALSVMCALAKAAPEEPGGFSISELTKVLDIRSRRGAYDAVDRLLKAGWIEKGRTDGRTRYHLANEGARQLQRLAATSDGPVRRATAGR